MNFSARVILLLACLATCWAVVYDDITQLPGSDYDFVIVGGTLCTVYFECTCAQLIYVKVGRREMC
jgi:hypothetical protein